MFRLFDKWSTCIALSPHANTRHVTRNPYDLFQDHPMNYIIIIIATTATTTTTIVCTRAHFFSWLLFAPATYNQQADVSPKYLDSIKPLRGRMHPRTDDNNTMATTIATVACRSQLIELCRLDWALDVLLSVPALHEQQMGALSTGVLSCAPPKMPRMARYKSNTCQWNNPLLKIEWNLAFSLTTFTVHRHGSQQ